MSDMEHLFIGDLRRNPDAEVRLLVDGRLVCGTWPRQVTQSIDAMIREAQAVAFDQGQKSGVRYATRLAAAVRIGRPDLPGPMSPNPYRAALTATRPETGS